MSNVVPFPFQTESPPARLGRYRLIASLGHGGMGRIHLAVAGGLGGFRKLFVVKELKPELTHNKEFLRLFMREARLAARLNHANVVHTIEADQDRGRYFLAMEFLDGQPFSEILRRAQLAPSVPLALRLQVICLALAGLHHAHELSDYDGKALQVVHRDVSPTNIFVTYDGQVKVLDFGIARAGDAEGTQPRGFKGKIGYAAPEQLRMRLSDRRLDVFAAGVVLWEAIALRHLVRGKLSPQVFEARIVGTEPRIGQLLPDLDPALASICDRAMAVDVEQRYPSAEAFRLALQEYLVERKLSVDATEIALLMRSKFADERAALHRLIEDQLRDDEDISYSFVATRDPLLFPPVVPPVGPAESIRPGSDESADFASDLRPKSQARYWIAGALALVAAAGAWRLRREDEVQQARSAPAPETASAGEVAAPAPPPATQEASANSAVPSTQAPAASAASKPQQQGQATSKATTKSSKSQAPETGVAAHGHGATKAPRPDSFDAHGQSSEAHGPTPEPSSEAPGSTRERDMDIDLRSLEPATRRPLDLDNPFH